MRWVPPAPPGVSDLVCVCCGLLGTICGLWAGRHTAGLQAMRQALLRQAGVQDLKLQTRLQGCLQTACRASSPQEDQMTVRAQLILQAC